MIKKTSIVWKIISFKGSTFNPLDKDNFLKQSKKIFNILYILKYMLNFTIIDMT